MLRMVVDKFSVHGRNKEVVKTYMGEVKKVHTTKLLRIFETGKWLWFLKSKVKYSPTL